MTPQGSFAKFYTLRLEALGCGFPFAQCTHKQIPVNSGSFWNQAEFKEEDTTFSDLLHFLPAPWGKADVLCHAVF